MGWMIPLFHTARRRREEGGEPCEDLWWALPLIVVSLLIVGVAVAVVWGIRLPTIAATIAVALTVAGLVVVLAFVVWLSRLR
jgi:hydrogenase/urease accessory protein HupE